MSHHVGVHSTGHLGILDNFVGFREIEVVFDCVASIEQCSLVVGFGFCDCLVEEGVDIGGKSVFERVEVDGEGVFLEVESGKLLAHILEESADFAHSFHVHFNFYAEFLGKDIHEFDSRSCRATAKIPYISVEDIHTVENCHECRSEAIAGSAVSVEVDGHIHSSFEFRHQ